MPPGFAAPLSARVAAAVLIVTLSGAAGLVPTAHATEHHHCQCASMGKGKQHQCSCPFCRLSALRAAANDGSLTPARRAAAREALRKEAERPANQGPCVSSRCGGTSTFVRSNSTVDPFLLPRLPVLCYAPTVERAHEPARAPARGASLPEIPPPRSTDT